MSLRVVLVKPSKYGADGFVERFRLGFMPNSTLPHLESYLPLRRKRFGFDRVPLPTSLALSVTDVDVNRRANPALLASSA